VGGGARTRISLFLEKRSVPFPFSERRKKGKKPKREYRGKGKRGKKLIFYFPFPEGTWGVLPTQEGGKIVSGRAPATKKKGHGMPFLHHEWGKGAHFPMRGGEKKNHGPCWKRGLAQVFNQSRKKGEWHEN